MTLPPSSTIRLLWLVVILNVLLIGVYVYGYMQLQQVVSRTRVVFQDVVAEEKKVAEIEAIKSALGEFKTYQDAVDALLVAPDGFVDFVEFFEGVARSSGVELIVEDLKTEDAKPKALTKLEYVQARFTVKGTWTHVMKFVSLMEVVPYQVYETGIVIETDKTLTTGDLPLWRAGLTVLVPKLK